MLFKNTVREQGSSGFQADLLVHIPVCPSALLRMVLVYNTMWVHVLVSVDFMRKLVPSFHDVDLSDQTRTVRVRELLLTKPSC